MKSRRMVWYLFAAAAMLQALALSWIFRDNSLTALFYRNLALALLPLWVWLSGVIAVPRLFFFFWDHGPGIAYLPKKTAIALKWNHDARPWGQTRQGLPLWIGYIAYDDKGLRIQILALVHFAVVINSA